MPRKTRKFVPRDATRATAGDLRLAGRAVVKDCAELLWLVLARDGDRVAAGEAMLLEEWRAMAARAERLAGGEAPVAGADVGLGSAGGPDEPPGAAGRPEPPTTPCSDHSI